MSSGLKLQPSSLKPPKNPNNAAQTDLPNPISNPNLNPETSMSFPITLSPEDLVLSRASHLTRPELLKRRSHILKQLSRCYRDHYWALMEDLKVQYREYYWKYGVSPFRQDQTLEVERENGERDPANSNAEGSGENGNNNNFGGISLDLKNNHQCPFVGCKLKAMALTSFCHLHILSDSKQKLYKACTYVIKSAQAGPITCGKPILRSTVPSLCSVHFQKAQTHVNRALKKAGLTVSSSSRLAPKFHVVVAEYVRQIQAKRKAAQRGNRSIVVVGEESSS
ncbi:hypothetical protein SLE2022_073310 [Rubroshorea leprosula]